METKHKFLGGSLMMFVWASICFVAAFTPEGIGAILVGLWMFIRYLDY